MYRHMGEREETRIPDVAGLAELVIQTLRETKESGNRLNRQTLAQFLSKKKAIMDLLRLAWESAGSECHLAGSR